MVARDCAGSMHSILLCKLCRLEGIKDTQCGFKLVFEQSWLKTYFLVVNFDGFSYDFEALMIGQKLSDMRLLKFQSVGRIKRVQRFG